MAKGASSVKRKSDFVELGGETVDGTPLKRRAPRRRLQPLARPGMCIMGDSGEYEQIIACTAEHCIARTEKGKEMAYRWDEVFLVDPAPDPEFALVKPK